MSSCIHVHMYKGGKKTPAKVLASSKATGHPVLFAISVCDNLRCQKVIISLAVSSDPFLQTSTIKLKTSINFRNSPTPKTTTEHTILNHCLFLAHHTLYNS